MTRCWGVFWNLQLKLRTPILADVLNRLLFLSVAMFCDFLRFPLTLFLHLLDHLYLSEAFLVDCMAILYCCILITLTYSRVVSKASLKIGRVLIIRSWPVALRARLYKLTLFDLQLVLLHVWIQFLCLTERELRAFILGLKVWVIDNCNIWIQELLVWYLLVVLANCMHWLKWKSTLLLFSVRLSLILIFLFKLVHS